MRICVFCGSNSGNNELYANAARRTDGPAQTVIRIVAALAQDELGRVLLVRKKGTRVFMQPGGKLQHSESHLAALERELGEELRCSVRPGSSVFLGTFAAPAANESNCLVEAPLYGVGTRRSNQCRFRN